MLGVVGKLADIAHAGGDGWPEPVRCSTCEPDGECAQCEAANMTAWMEEAMAAIDALRRRWAREDGASMESWPWLF